MATAYFYTRTGQTPPPSGIRRIPAYTPPVPPPAPSCNHCDHPVSVYNHGPALLTHRRITRCCRCGREG